MSIELNTSEGRKQYLTEKLDDLLDAINESYGTVLMEELLNRLELTIRDFNDEMKILCDQLVKKQEERQHLLEMIKSSNEMNTQIKSGKSSTPDVNSSLDTLRRKTTEQLENNILEELKEDIPIWEKKLAKLEKK